MLAFLLNLNRNYWSYWQLDLIILMLVLMLIIFLGFNFFQPALNQTSTISSFAMSSNSTPESSPTIDWSSRWLYSIPCAPPCWEGISPGQTTLEEAVEILKQNPTVNLSTIKVFNKPERVGVAWNSLPTGVHNTAYLNIAYADINDSKHIIYEIVPRYTNGFKLGKIISVYGNPTFAYGSTFSGHSTSYSISFFWEKEGIKISSSNYTSAKLIINNNLTVDGPSFILPTYVDPPLSTWIDWKGYVDFDTYSVYKEREDPMFQK